ncbi:diguanylate cyclase [Pseudodesulfovibrio sp. JC047]|uniref:sensor domain-containing diguanylate cyclase n=1 Tax=Pseudodesulfovibrio sp. JC047 TaxID=2683199 RepID=UPI0013CFEA3D|nr:diguanylate cyclase [Pseudodesulfovibrio sp. JC047]NDV20728.1 diguanylate cyclase [Pseudodesulfovibrio sp. JC047]
MSSSNSLFTKFLARTLPPLFVAAFLLMFFFGYTNQQHIREEINTDIEVFATSISRVLDDLMWNYQTEELVSALGTISSNPAMLGAQLFYQDGESFLKYGIQPSDDPTILTVKKAIYKLQSNGHRLNLGSLEIYYSYKEADSQFHGYLVTQAVRFLLGILVFSIAGIYAYQTTIGTPLKKLLQAIRTTEDTGKWTEVAWQADDEIGEVIAAHNSLIFHISQKEEALAESRQRYRHLFDSALVGIFLIRPDGTVVEANKTVASILHYESVEAMTAKNVHTHYKSQQDRERLWAELDARLVISNFQTRLIRTDGEIIWAEMNGRLTPDGLFNGVLQDITTQVEARKALKERDELHRAFFEDNKAVMLLHDPQDATIRFVNPAACQYYGYSNDELTSMTIRDLDRMSDTEIFEELARATSEQRNYFKHFHTLKDGSRHPVEVFTGPVSLANRQLHYSIVHDVTEKRRMEAKLKRMATRDQLTGAYNRHAFFQIAQDEVTRAHRFDHPMAVLMFDLDHFKQVNDTHGHAIGDEVLRAFALRCRADLRQCDIFARLGGEEFAAILVETDATRATQVAERIRTLASHHSTPTPKGPITVTVSIGVASLQKNDTITTLLNRADAGLYTAKKSGRNSACRN